MQKFTSSGFLPAKHVAKETTLVVPAAPDFASRAVEIGVLSDLGALFAEQQQTLLGEASDEDAIDDLMISLFDEVVQDDAQLFSPERDFR